ncbi:MAG: hypothetical protein HZC28_00805 [Spirochaetes bacterium]|nr:hypothetical protein [Spirochaetota bacterium]
MTFKTFCICITTLAASLFSIEPFVVNLREQGAAGDGITDDQPSITKAASSIAATGGTLYFPKGTYRCARQNSACDGIYFKDATNINIIFDAGTVLLMDNLSPENGKGDRGHGIHFEGACRNIVISNVTVRWKTRASSRSKGDGFNFFGYPGDAKSIANVRMINCRAEQCPQTGAVLMGCSDVTVDYFHVENNLADGLHFNACRRVHVKNHTGISNGDDTLAFVTYYDENGITNHYTGGPYVLPSLGEWNNSGSDAENITAIGGRANGIRISGASNVSISNVRVDGKSSGIICDSGRKDGSRFSWTYLASRGIHINGLYARRVNTGFFVWNFNEPLIGDERFWRYGITANDITAVDCGNDGMHLFRCAGVTVSNVLSVNRRIRVATAQQCTLDTVNVSNASLGFYANDLTKPDKAGLSANDITVSGGDIIVDRYKNVTLTNITINGKKLSTDECAMLGKMPK